MREANSPVPTVEAIRFRRGYSTPAHLREDIKAAHRTNPWRTAAAALADQALIVAACVAAGRLLAAQPLAGVPVALLATVLVGRQLRALECLVHEGSHFNWSRKRRMLNDVLSTALAAFPTGAQLSGYRESHLRHHGSFGTADDPDRQRYRELDLEAIDRTRLAPFVVGLLKRLPAYQRTWWRDSLQAAPAVALLPLVWGAVFAVAPAWALAGDAAAIGAAAVWLAGFAVALPILRFIGEAGEHVYSDADTVFDATVSNLGTLQRALIHPHNDGYHTVHHMWPGVPHHRLAWLHRRLMTGDPAYASRLRRRSGVLATPVRGA
ncbi:fatty acid desaturase family protein [Glycomyces sp. TRM65418]|uniref:fatty acid desaturase family protein n=1 Tax=Glycomyces sp. TRM65418 TaxID=2867006 RepID=UPI001CE57F26|nr:fatty acid desaturase family protein [Glycomyces sp. TRM65418]MCC3763392.1 fatty acid desaturase family protein [Glycomyces sp. TRM65418]QZD57383.1 fatty acid desaturase family protein [Glycomyces sp. TRM65418]